MRSEGSFHGANLDEALSSACSELKARVGELHYEVSESAGAQVVIDASIDPVAVLGLFLVESFRAAQLDVSVRLEPSTEGLVGELSGDDLRLLTAGDGRGLDALQYLCNRVLNRRLVEHCPVHLDAAGFKDRRARELQVMAENAAEECLRRRAPVRRPPRPPAAPRAIHMGQADHPPRETQTQGGRFLKRVVVRPRGRR